MLGGRRFLLVCAVSVAGVLLALAFHLPFMRLSTLLLIGHGAQEHSLISAVHTLVRTNQFLLGGVLLALAIFLPLLKWLYLLLLAVLPGREIARAEAPLRALAWLGRWWPQDVVALAATAAIVATQETLLQRTAGGAYCLAATVVAMTLAYAWLRADAGAVRMRAPGAAATPRSPAFAVLVALAVVAFAVGLTLPVVWLRSVGTGGAALSIVELIMALQAGGQTVLWVALAILAILLPGLRLLYLLTAAIASRAVRATEPLGRHAIADTMVLSLALFYLIATREADPILQPGVYCLAASAALTLAAYAWANLPVPAKPSTLKDRLKALTPEREGAEA
jgi:uncharacterized paraquat-inducible protein A